MSITYRAGVIGCGRIGTGLDDEVFDREVQDESWRARPCTHAGNYALHQRTELVAGADPKPRRRERFREKWGIENVYSDYVEMLEKESLDIVSVATFSTLHHPITIAAAQAGVKAVFCEKPLAASLKEADEIIRVCEENGVKLIVNHTMRFHPNMPRARQLIEDGTIGELRTIACYFGEWLIHMGTHLFDLLSFFAGEPDFVFGHLDTEDIVDTDGTGYIYFENGIRALVDARPRVSFGFLELMGTKGLIRFGHDMNNTFELWLPSKDTASSNRPRLEQHRFPGVSPEEEAKSPKQGRFVCPAAIDEIVACLDADRESFSSGRHARWALEMAMGMYHSHQAGGCVIELPNQDRSLYLPEATPDWVLEARKRI